MMLRLLMAVALLAAAGCASRDATLVEAFPPAGAADPWFLQESVWTGSFETAIEALGDDAQTWAGCNPTQVWLAVYCHRELPQRCLKIRAFAFADVADARRAFAAFQPPDAKRYHVGDEGCWTEIGVLFRWGRVVFDVFGPEASWGSQVQSSYLAAILVKRIPPALVENPR